MCIIRPNLGFNAFSMITIVYHAILISMITHSNYIYILISNLSQNQRFTRYKVQNLLINISIKSIHAKLSTDKL